MQVQFLLFYFFFSMTQFNRLIVIRIYKLDLMCKTI